jgi:dihydroflavonol-4-reductase
MVFVTGATGLVGSHLLQALVNNDEQIVALVRNPNLISPELLPLQNINWKTGDVRDRQSLYEAIEGCSEVYHCAALVSYQKGDGDSMDEINTFGTKEVVNAALNFKIKKLVYVSSVAAIGRDEDHSIIKESNEWTENEFISDYSKSKHLAEMEVFRGMAEGLDAVIINPSLIIGEGDWTKSSLTIFKTLYHKFPFYSNGETGVVDVKDVVRAMIILMKSEITDERFIVCAKNISYRDLFFLIADSFGNKRPSVSIDKWQSEIAWRLYAVKGFLTGKKQTVTKESARLSQLIHNYDNSKIKNALNFEFTPLEESVQRICNYYSEKNKK